MTTGLSGKQREYVFYQEVYRKDIYTGNHIFIGQKSEAEDTKLTVGDVM